MTRAIVLEALRSFGSPVSPAVLATELGLPVRPVQVALAALWTKGLAERDGRGVYVPANTTCGYCAGPVGEHLHVLDDRPLCGACYSRVAIPTEARSAS